MRLKVRSRSLTSYTLHPLVVGPSVKDEMSDMNGESAYNLAIGKIQGKWFGTSAFRQE
jgi:hypothetical protein